MVVVLEFKKAKSISRLAAVQLMYEKNLLNTTTDNAIERFNNYISKDELYSEMHKQFFKKLVSHFSDNIQFQSIYESNLSSTAGLQDSEIINSLLKVAIIEMMYTNLAKPIIINEYVELAKDFMNQNEVKMVNAVLDKISKNI